MGYTYDYNGGCIIAVSYFSDNNKLYILGDTFLRNFVSTYDYQGKKMTLGININAPEGVKISKKLSPWQWTGIIAGVALGIVLIALLVWCIYKKCKKDKKKQAYQTIDNDGMIGENGNNISQNEESLYY